MVAIHFGRIRIRISNTIINYRIKFFLNFSLGNVEVR